MHNIPLSAFSVPLLECLSICVVSECENAHAPAIQSTLYIRTSTYIHGVHRHYSAQPGSFALPLPHARVPPPMLGRIVMCWPCSIPTPITLASPASSSGNSGSPASPSAIPELAVVDEHVSCARNHASRERHGHQQVRDRGYRMGPGRGSGPDGRRRPRGCRWPFRPTGGP